MTALYPVASEPLTNSTVRDTEHSSDGWGGQSFFFVEAAKLCL
jgi:hypothetical protein